jgi:hypothetical protein
MLTFGAIGKSVSSVMDALPVSVSLGGKLFRADELYRIASAAGVLENFSSTDIQRTLAEYAASRNIIGRFLVAQPHAVRDVADLIATRQRLGFFLTLIDSGMPPREAAEKAAAALFDYKNSLHPIERNWVMTIFHPFWAFEKNNTKRTLLMFLNPGALYRGKVVYQTKRLGAQLASEGLDPRDEYGFDTEAMEEDDRARKGPSSGLRRDASPEPPVLPRYREALKALQARGVTPEEVRRTYLAGGSVPELDAWALDYWNGDPTESMLPRGMYNRITAWAPYSRTAASRYWLQHGEGVKGRIPDDWRAIPLPDDSNIAGLGVILGGAAWLSNAGRALVEADPGAYTRMSELARDVVGDPGQNPAALFVLGTLLGYDMEAYNRTLPPGTGEVLARVFGPRVAFASKELKQGAGGGEEASFKDVYKMPAGTGAVLDMAGMIGPFLATAGTVEQAMGARSDAPGSRGYAWLEAGSGLRAYDVSRFRSQTRADLDSDARVKQATSGLSNASTQALPRPSVVVQRQAREVFTATWEKAATANPEAAAAVLEGLKSRLARGVGLKAGDASVLRMLAVQSGVSPETVDTWSDQDAVREASRFLPGVAVPPEVR